MKQWQLKAIVAALAMGTFAGVGAQTSSSDTRGATSATEPPSAGALVRSPPDTVLPGDTSAGRDCSALTGDLLIQCIREQQSGASVPGNGAIGTPRSGMIRGGGTGAGPDSGTPGAAASGNANGNNGNANGNSGTAGAAGGAASGGAGAGGTGSGTGGGGPGG